MIRTLPLRRRPGPRPRRQRSWPVVLVLALLTACSADVPGTPTAVPSAAAPSIAAPSAAPTAAAPTPTPRSSSPARPRTTDEPTARAAARKPPDLVGNRNNGWAFAPLGKPRDVTVEGRLTTGPAYSTSKVLVVAAFLDTAAGGDPGRVSARNRRLIRAALQRSDNAAVTAIRNQIPGRAGPAMTAVLRDIGDERTVAPDSYQGLMRWRIREQVRFMAALRSGKVVSREASAYLRRTMRPIKAHAWGIGKIGASAYKGGWLRRDTVTRQMGIVDGYAVAIITNGGSALQQSDGDAAHVRQMNRLARLLKKRLAYENSR